MVRSKSISNFDHEKVRIAYVAGDLGVPDHDRCNALCRAGAKTALVIYGKNNEYQWHIPSKSEYKLVRIKTNSKNIFFKIISWKKLLSSIRGLNPDIVLIYGFQKNAFFLLAFIMRILGKYVISLNDSRFDDYPRNILVDLAKTIYLAPYQGILTATGKAASYVKYLGKKHTSNYYCAIDTARISRASKVAYGAAKFRQRYFLMIARFEAKKNHAFILDCYEQYIKRSINPRQLFLVGYGSLENQIKQIVASSETLRDMVVIKGYEASDNLPTTLGKSLALLLPSEHDQFGIVVTEAFSAGIPVLISQNCGAVEIVQSGINGMVLNAENQEEWIKAMIHLEADENRWIEFSEHAQSAASQADVLAFVGAINDLVPTHLDIHSSASELFDE